jgi:hypothetical protein
MGRNIEGFCVKWEPWNGHMYAKYVDQLQSWFCSHNYDPAVSTECRPWLCYGTILPPLNVGHGYVMGQFFHHWCIQSIEPSISGTHVICSSPEATPCLSIGCSQLLRPKPFNHHPPVPEYHMTLCAMSKFSDETPLRNEFEHIGWHPKST